jgi:predicted ATPase with chaperone activity
MNTATAPQPTAAGAPAVPRVPDTIRDTGLSQEMIVDLILKTLYIQGARTGQQLTEFLGLPFPLLDDEILTLQQRRIVEVKGAGGGGGRIGYTFDITTAGRERARDALEANQYIGPAPVPLEQYRHWIDRQSIRHLHVTRERIAEGFRDMVMDRALFEMLGPAVNSAKSLFLYGDSGNGKTLIAESIATMFGSEMYVPYAVDIDGQTMVIYDPVFHRPPEDPSAGGQGIAASLWRQSAHEYDRRFARVRRPVVAVGGELTLDQLDLQYDPFTKMYQAPFQVKANGGVLIIDDFGRQRVPPRDLLNRWIVPLEKRIDYLSLHTGNKFPVPFDCLMIISTNLDPSDLVEEAFLRRIRYKVNVESPTRPQYTEIFRRMCEASSVPFEEGGVDFVYREFYDKRGIAPRSCHPRDILEHVHDASRFLEVPPALSDDLLHRACSSYFLDLAALAASSGR